MPDAPFRSFLLSPHRGRDGKPKPQIPSPYALVGCRRWVERVGGDDDDVLLLSDPLAGFVESVGADEAHREEVVGRAETARGEVALLDGTFGQLVFPGVSWQWV